MESRQAQRLANNSDIFTTLSRRGYTSAQMVAEYLMYQYRDSPVKSDDQIIYEITGIQSYASTPRDEPYRYHDTPYMQSGYDQQTYRRTDTQQPPPQEPPLLGQIDFKQCILPIIIVAVIMIVYYLSPIDEALDAALLAGDIIQIILTGVGFGVIGYKGVEIGRAVVHRINR